MIAQRVRCALFFCVFTIKCIWHIVVLGKEGRLAPFDVSAYLAQAGLSALAMISEHAVYNSGLL